MAIFMNDNPLLCTDPHKGTNPPALPQRDPQQDPWGTLTLVGVYGMLCWDWGSLWGFYWGPGGLKGYGGSCVGVCFYSWGLRNMNKRSALGGWTEK